ncbi:MAG: DUF6932 family protein [Chloroflexota bacterium]
MIPPFDSETGNLHPGIHEANWSELVERDGYTPHRLRLLAGLKDALDALRAAGCRRAYIDGSFVTAKEEPGDGDGCWEAAGVDPELLDPVLLDFASYRAAQKAKYMSEFFVADWAADLFGTPFIEFFQRDKDTDEPKGIIAINLENLP